MSQRTTMKTTRETLDRLRPYAHFRDSWDTVVNNVLDIAETKQGSKHENWPLLFLFKEFRYTHERRTTWMCFWYCKRSKRNLRELGSPQSSLKHFGKALSYIKNLLNAILGRQKKPYCDLCKIEFKTMQSFMEHTIWHWVKSGHSLWNF